MATVTGTPARTRLRASCGKGEARERAISLHRHGAEGRQVATRLGLLKAGGWIVPSCCASSAISPFLPPLRRIKQEGESARRASRQQIRLLVAGDPFPGVPSVVMINCSVRPQHRKGVLFPHA
jgi:hypothetical protein